MFVFCQLFCFAHAQATLPITPASYPTSGGRWHRSDQPAVSCANRRRRPASDRWRAGQASTPRWRRARLLASYDSIPQREASAMRFPAHLFCAGDDTSSLTACDATAAAARCVPVPFRSPSLCFARWLCLTPSLPAPACRSPGSRLTRSRSPASGSRQQRAGRHGTARTGRVRRSGHPAGNVHVCVRINWHGSSLSGRACMGRNARDPVCIYPRHLLVFFNIKSFDNMPV